MVVASGRRRRTSRALYGWHAFIEAESYRGLILLFTEPGHALALLVARGGVPEGPLQLEAAGAVAVDDRLALPVVERRELAGEPVEFPDADLFGVAAQVTDRRLDRAGPRPGQEACGLLLDDVARRGDHLASLLASGLPDEPLPWPT